MPKHGRGPGAPGRGTRGPREAPPLRDTDRGKGRSPASRTLSPSPFPPNLLSGRGRPVIQGAQVQTGRHPGVTPARRGGQCGIAGCPDTEGGLPFRKAKGTGHTDSPPPPPGVQESREVTGARWSPCPTRSPHSHQCAERPGPPLRSAHSGVVLARTAPRTRAETQKKKMRLGASRAEPTLRVDAVCPRGASPNPGRYRRVRDVVPCTCLGSRCDTSLSATI